MRLYENYVKRGIELEIDFQPVPTIKALPSELSQIWTNLIHNAVQAMQNKGRLEVRVEAVTGGEYIIVSITDSGPGIPPEIQPRIFEPFFTTKPAGEGSGLGLDIVKKIVEKHNGQISFESESGRTTFFVRLPIGQ